MTRLATVEEFLYTAVAESRGCTTDEVRAQLGGGGEIDSLEGVELVVAAEGEFGVRIPDKDLAPDVCRSIPRLARLVAAAIP